MLVYLKAQQIYDCGNGTFEITLASKPLPPETGAILEKLFPHTFNQIEELLAQEALLASIATPADRVKSVDFSKIPGKVATKPQR